jgi:hypothetical protein
MVSFLQGKKLGFLLFCSFKPYANRSLHRSKKYA